MMSLPVVFAQNRAGMGEKLLLVIQLSILIIPDYPRWGMYMVGGIIIL